MPIRTTGGVFNEQILSGSLAHYVICGADFSGAIDSYGLPVPNSAAEIIFVRISESAYINIMNPNECNISFALEEGRSTWDEISLTAMVRSLGTDVGIDHIDCTLCTVKRVPYIWGCNNGSYSFLDLSDTPTSYEGYANYVLTVNSTENGIVFSPSSGVITNSFSVISSPTQPNIVASGNDTLTFIAGSNTVITTNPSSKSITISAGSSDYIPIIAGALLNFGMKYFVSSAGIVTLPTGTGSGMPAGTSITVTKKNNIVVFINTGSNDDIIATDLGNTDSIEFDATQETVFVFDGISTWNLQIGTNT